MYFSRSSVVGYRTEVSYIHDVFHILFVWPGGLVCLAWWPCLTPPSAWGYTETPFCVEFARSPYVCVGSLSSFLPLRVVNLSASPWSC